MDFKVIFYGKHSRGLIDYSQVLFEGTDFIDLIKGSNPKYRNLNPGDIKYIRNQGNNTISNSRYELLLSLDKARETGLFNKCTEIGVSIEGYINDLCGYTVKEYWLGGFFIPFLKRLEKIDVRLDVDDEEIYTAWKAAGFPREWKI